MLVLGRCRTLKDPAMASYAPGCPSCSTARVIRIPLRKVKIMKKTRIYVIAAPPPPTHHYFMGVFSIYERITFKNNHFLHKTGLVSNIPWNIFLPQVLSFERVQTSWMHCQDSLVNDTMKSFVSGWVFVNFTLLIKQYKTT